MERKPFAQANEPVYFQLTADMRPLLSKVLCVHDYGHTYKYDLEVNVTSEKEGAEHELTRIYNVESGYVHTSAMINS